MKNTFLLIAFISIFLSNNKVIAQCTVAEKYVADIQKFQDNATPTEYASSGKKIQAWTQFATWNTYKCQCDSPDNLSDSEIPQLVNAMNATRGIISKEYSTYGTVPRAYKVSDCKKGNSNSTNSASSKTSTQIEMEKRFQNYNNAMNLKRQGENIAKAYAQQVKSYGKLNETNSPEALLQNFNNNMQAIADLQTQNKADNLNQLTNTLNSTINDLNSGNPEGALFSTLSLLDQGEAKREARREAEIVKQNLIYQTQKKMTTFYWKAVNLNNQAINQYYEKAAYAYSKEEETYLLEYIENLECHKKYMETNFNYSSTVWTQNRCAVPEKRTYTFNNLIAKDIQYINAAKRKYALYEKTREPIFQQGAMRFAGLAATVNPTAEYYYQMGHFAGTNNPLVAYSSFLTAESKNAKYFAGEKLAEFTIAKTSLELYFRKAIEENGQEIIKNIVGAGLHRSVSIDDYLPIIYAINVDQADVVYAFLNTELEGKPQSVITNKVQEVISMAAILDAPKTIQKFVDLGFSVDFILDGKTPLDVAEEALAVKSFNKILELLSGQSKYNLENSEIVKISEMNKAANLNDTIRVTQLYGRLSDAKSKNKVLLELLMAKQQYGFFVVLDQDTEFTNSWVQENRPLVFEQFCLATLNRNNPNAYKFIDPKIITLSDDAKLNKEDYTTFMKVWIEASRKDGILPKDEQNGFAKYELIENKAVTKYFIKLVLGDGVWDIEKIDATFEEDEFYEHWYNKTAVYEGVIEDIAQNRKWDSNNSKIDVALYNSLRSIDMIDFAIHYRFDSKMLNLLSEHYNESFHNKIQSIKVEVGSEELSLYNFFSKRTPLPNTDLYPFNENSDVTTDIGDPIIRANIQKSIVENRYEIFKLLMLEYGINKNAIENLVRNVVFSETRSIDYNYYKSLIDLLIENGYSSEKFKIKSTYYNQNSLAKWNLEIKNNGDSKYWKAIMSGNYDKRY